MSSTNRQSFQRSLGQFQRELSDEQKEQFDGASLQSLNATIQDMQAKLGRDKKLCNFTRIRGFLEAMEQVEKLVTIFLNVHEVVAFVWRPIKLALMVATAWTNSMKQLLDVYVEIGEALGNLAFFHTLIKRKEHLRLILEDYFSDILRFHLCVLDVFSRPNWKTFFKAAWGRFRHRINPIIQSLKRRQDMLSDDKLQSHAILEEVRGSSSRAEDRFNGLEAELEQIRNTLASDHLRGKASQEQHMKDLLEEKLGIDKSRPYSQLESSELRPTSSGDWIFSHPTFQAWENEQSLQNNVLFLNGSPGAGKTSLARKVVRYLDCKPASKTSNHRCLVYFFFKHNDADRTSIKSMLRAILSQFIHNDETILRYLYEKCGPMGNVELSSTETLQGLAQECLIFQHNAYVILDGLDECAGNEPQAVLTWYLDRVLPSGVSRSCHLKLLVSGQRDGRLDPLLSTQPQIRLDTIDSHRMDIEEYSKFQAAEITARFSQTREAEEELVNKVTTASQGMFLYAKVVMENLLSVDSIAEFEDEMESDNFPDDLDQAYGRILHRVLDQTGSSRQKTVKQMLGWIICAKRPLRWREIQSRFCIDADKGVCNAKYRRVDNCKNICSSLVDVTICDVFPAILSEQIVTMVHETASKYLIQRGTINLLQEHSSMALFCCRYLSSPPFLSNRDTGSLNDDSRGDKIRSGYFGFLDYAAVNCLSHAKEALNIESYSEAIAKTGVIASVACLVQTYVDEAARQINHPVDGNTTWASVERDLLCSNNKETLILGIEDCAAAIRFAMESRQDELSRDDIFLNLSGPTRFKCERIDCYKFASGFPTQHAREKHSDMHQRPFRCTYADCFASVVGYPTPRHLEDHCEAIHADDSGPKVTFPPPPGTKIIDISAACQAGNLEEVKRFHLAEAQLYKREPARLVKPLYLATKAGHANICNYLIDQGIDPFLIPNMRKRPGISEYLSSPMFEAIRQRNAPIAELYANSSFVAESINKPHLPILVAVTILEGFSDGLELLLRSQLYLRDVPKAEQVVKELILHTGRDCSEGPTKTTLMHTLFRRVFSNLYYGRDSAFGANHHIQIRESAEYAACKKTLFHQSGSHCLHQVLRRRCHSLSAFLLDLADMDDLQTIDEKGRTPLHSLATSTCSGRPCECFLSITQRIIEIDGGISANTADYEGNLPISLAASLDPSGIFEALLKHTKNLSHKNSTGKSVMECALGNINYLRMLVDSGRVDLFDRNDQGQTLFAAEIASVVSRIDLLEILIEADVRLAWTADDSTHRLTPLHYAMARENDQMLGESYRKVAKILLSLPDVENVLRAFSNTTYHDTDAHEKVREFARRENLRGALEVIHRIGF